MSLRCAAGSGGLNAAQQRDSRLAGSFTPIWKKKLAMPDIPSEEFIENLALATLPRLPDTFFLPPIPLVGDAAVDIGTYPWPRHRLNPKDNRTAIETRFKRIAEVEGNCGLFSSAAGWLAGHLAKGAVADFVIGLMTKALTGANDPVA
jgi:hypothetical protein